MKLAFSLATFVLCFTSFLQAEPLLEKTDLFEGGKDGFALYRIPGVVVTSKGTILTYCEARKNSGSDWGEIEVHLRRSTDSGKTWSAAQKIAHEGTRLEGNPTKKSGGETEQTVNNPVAIVDKDGTIHFLYCVNYARCFYMQSKDDGVTFSQPVEITATFEPFRKDCPWTVLATGPGHGIQITSGRLVVPVWLAYGKDGAHAPSLTSTIYSNDQGKTWQAGEIAVPNEGTFRDPNETSIAQLSDGRVMLNTRSKSDANRKLITYSEDGATKWSTPQFDSALWEPICMASVTTLPQKSGTLLFACPRTLKLDEQGKEIPGASSARENLSLYLSPDDGKTWPIIKTLEEGKSAYSDLAILPNGDIISFYERDKRLTFAKFNLQWLMMK